MRAGVVAYRVSGTSGWVIAGLGACMVRIVLADDHEVVRAGLKGVIARHESWIVCGEAANGQDAVAKVVELRPDIVILDVSMPIMSGIQAAITIRKAAPATKILILTTHDESIMLGMSASADAYLSKNSSTSKLIPTLTALLNAEGKSATA